MKRQKSIYLSPSVAWIRTGDTDLLCLSAGTENYGNGASGGIFEGSEQYGNGSTDGWFNN